MSLAEGNLEKAFAKTIVSGMKLATDNPFKDPLANPLALAAALRSLGIEALVWKPETLFAAIDRKFNYWSDQKVGEALDKFHDTGLIQTDVPSLVRQKIYAIRIIATSDTAHNEWHVFEKVGCAFNDRVAQWGIVEKLSPGECARTIAIIEHIRPDDDNYSREVRTYIAASCYEEGMLTTSPSKYLSMCDDQLRQIMRQDGGSEIKFEMRNKISDRVTAIRGQLRTMAMVEDITTIQALKIIAVDACGDQVIP